MSGGACSCGLPEPHEIARRTTFDGGKVCLWSDGMLTARMGLLVPGIGRKRLPMDRLWEVANEAPLLTMPEVVEQFQIHHAIERRLRRTGTKPAMKSGKE